MNLKRTMQSFRLLLIPTAKGRAQYLKKHNMFGRIGEGCLIQKWKIPLYPNLIRIGDNVRVSPRVSFLTHDTIHKTLNTLDSVKAAGGVQENIGCIEIGDNVFLGVDVKIMADVKIGNNVIVAAGTYVTKDIPDDVVIAGTPAKIIGTVEEYAQRALQREKWPEELKPRKQQAPDELAKWLWERFDEKRRQTAASEQDAVK